jgi:hypothetical protein
VQPVTGKLTVLQTLREPLGLHTKGGLNLATGESLMLCGTGALQLTHNLVLELGVMR